MQRGKNRSILVAMLTRKICWSSRVAQQYIKKKKKKKIIYVIMYYLEIVKVDKEIII